MTTQPMQQFYSDVETKKTERPESVLIPVPGTFDGVDVEVGIIKNGEKGFHYAVTERHTEEWIHVQNEQAGIDDETVLTFRVCSITGNWEQYDEVLSKFQGKSSDV